MAPWNSFVDKVVASVILFALLNVNEGHCFFYPQPAIARPEGHHHHQPLYDYHEPPNRVGYGYKPSWADIHLQPIPEETPQYQQQEPADEKPSYQTQQVISQPQYAVPAHTYLQQSDKYQILSPKYQWAVQPSVKYNLPTITNPLTYRDPQQHVNVLVPLRAFGVQTFPPFLERLIQRIQTYYSIYNPPETLTLPYNINTPPTFTASSLLPGADTPFITPEDESNVINANFPNIDINSVDNPEGISPEDTVTQSPESGSDNNSDGRSSTEGSTSAVSTTEDTTKEESVENTTAPASSEDSSKSDDTDDKNDSTTAATSDNDNSDASNSTESTNSDDQNSSTDKENTTEAATTESSSSS